MHLAAITTTTPTKRKGKMMAQRITLQPGDYVATADIKDEAEYHAIAKAFMEAGCKNSILGDWSWKDFTFHEWYKSSLCGTLNLEAVGRQLTPVKILDTPQWVPEVGERALVNNDPGYHIEYGENVIGKEVEVKALFKSGDIDVAAVEYDGSCYCFRVEMLVAPTTEEDRAVEEMREVMKAAPGACHNEISLRALYRAGYRKQPQPAEEIDLDDPANWRAGDWIECTTSALQLIKGVRYEVLNMVGDNNPVIRNEDGEREERCSELFKHYSRP